MARYEVYLKEDPSKLIFTYDNDTPIEWLYMEFDTHEHRVVPSPVPKLPPIDGEDGYRHVTKLQFRKLLRPNEEAAVDKIRAKFESMPFTDAQKDAIRVINNKYQEATFIDLDDPDNAMGLHFFATLGALDGHYRVAEILAL